MSNMTRAVIYARFSTDRQNETSIQDQVRQAKQHIGTNGWHHVGTYSDERLSGSTPMSERPGGSQLLAAALAGTFDTLVIESLDRAFRDLVEQETVVRNLEHAGIRIVGIADHYDSQADARKLPRVMRGLINEIYIDDLRKKTHRGLAGQFQRGYHTGGLSYGYRTTAIDQQGHRLEIDPEKAEIVREIFQKYADGHSPRTIAKDLNTRGIPSPRGGTWSLSAIYGNRKKACGILANELYIGNLIWNRTQWVKIPGSSKRKRIDRPESEWQRRRLPELQIIDTRLWQRVQARRERMANITPNGRRASRTLLSGLLVCGHCGGAVIAVDKYCYGCGQHKDRGTCRKTVRIPRKQLEKRIIAIVRHEILSETTLQALQRAIRKVIKERQKRTDTQQPKIAKKEKEIDNLVDAIGKAGLSPALSQRLARSEKELEEMKEQQRQDKTIKRIPDIMPDMKNRFQACIEHLEDVLTKDTDKAREVLYALLGKITIVEKKNTLYAEISVQGNQLLMLSNASGVGSGGPLFQWKRDIPLKRLHHTEKLKLVK